MAEPVDNLDVKKKELEIEKLQKEITKLERESTELRWRKWSNWGAAIIAICSVAIVGLNGYLIDSKAKLVKEETLNQQAKNNKLISQKSKIQKQLDSLEQKFIQDKLKFDKERVKYGYVISQKEKEIGGLRNEKSELISEKTKIEDCYSRASDFMRLCIKNDEVSHQEYFLAIPPPFKNRFVKSFDEISKMDYSKMDYSTFLQTIANFKIDSSNIGVVYLVSEDEKIKIMTFSNQGSWRAGHIIREQGKLKGQFNCWKRLSPQQRLKLLNQIIIRTQ
jgi:hypothetical protein